MSVTKLKWMAYSSVTLSVGLPLASVAFLGDRLGSRALFAACASELVLDLVRTASQDMWGEEARVQHAHYLVCVPASHLKLIAAQYSTQDDMGSAFVACLLAQLRLAQPQPGELNYAQCGAHPCLVCLYEQGSPILTSTKLKLECACCAAQDTCSQQGGICKNTRGGFCVQIIYTCRIITSQKRSTCSALDHPARFLDLHVRMRRCTMQWIRMGMNKSDFKGEIYARRTRGCN